MHTSFKIGGPADYFAIPKNAADLKLLLKLAKANKIPIYVLGAGSNILAVDKGIRAVVLQLSSPAFKRVKLTPRGLEAGSGVALGSLIQYSRQRGLAGLEFLAGIPGTLGGALAMNAACWGKSIAGLVDSVTVMDYSGGLKILPRESLRFSYRKSSLVKYIILGVKLKLKKVAWRQIDCSIRQYLRQRLGSHDNSFPSAGCVFKNPAGSSAGMLIEACGLKGKKIGGACISQKHANFILNYRSASASDVLKLMKLARAAVRRKFKINLVPEVKIWR